MLGTRGLLVCGAVTDASSRSAPQCDPFGLYVAVSDRVYCDTCSLAISGYVLADMAWCYF